MDLYALGAYLNALALALLWGRQPRPRSTVLIAGVWTAVFLGGLWSLQREAHAIYLDRVPALKAAERQHVRAFLATGDPAVLRLAPRAELPYPDPQDLAQLLSTPGLRALLPLGIRPALAMAPGPGSYGFEEAAPSELAPGAPGRAWVAQRGPARFVSEPIAPGLLPLLHLSVRGGPGAPVLHLEAADGAVSSAAGQGGKGWAAVDLPVPSESTLRLVVDLPPGEHGFAFTSPVELGYASWLNRWLIRRGGILAAVAGALFAAGILLVSFVDTRLEEGFPQAGP